MISALRISLMALALTFSGTTAGHAVHDVAPADGSIGKTITLTAHDGRTISESDLHGKPYIVHFGYTHCPDVCPTTLLELSRVLADLGPVADRIVPLFITVDPERDTLEILAKYMTSFDPRILALRGELDTTRLFVRGFRASFEKEPLAGGGYSIRHTTSVLMLDAHGRYAGVFDMNTPEAEIRSKLQHLADSVGQP